MVRRELGRCYQESGRTRNGQVSNCLHTRRASTECSGRFGPRVHSPGQLERAFQLGM